MKVLRLVLLIIFSGQAMATGGRAIGAGRPNILLITADNVGYGDLGCFGSTVVRTPALDQLAREGVMLRDLYAPAPICSPSRAALLTGRYPQRNGLVDVLPSEPQHSPEEGNLGPGLRRSEKLLPAYLKSAGYRTGAFGKWHIGFTPGSRPTERGFDEYLGNASGNFNYYSHVHAGRRDLFRGTDLVDMEGYSTDLFADAAIAFIARREAAPFFVHLAYNAAHYTAPKNNRPGETSALWQAPPAVLASYGPGAAADQARRYAAVVTALDAATGRVLRKVDELGLRENTLVIFWSDNGAFMMNAGVGLGVASNAPFRSGGTKLWEGGIRVPGIVRWPGRTRAGTQCRVPLTAMDFFATMLAAAGIASGPETTIDGRDATDVLSGSTAALHDALGWEFRGMAAIRKGNYKLLREKPDGPWKVFDLLRDPAESNDLAASFPALEKDLEHEFVVWRARVSQ